MRIATRGSALALWQARTVARLIEETGGPRCEILVVRTSGDEPGGPPDPPTASASADGRPFSAGPTLNIKRTFVKEIEDALLDGRADLAVHSCKDLPAVLPEGLVIAAALEREDPRDALVLPSHVRSNGLDAVKATLGKSPRLGTSSVRRIVELRAVFPNATFDAIRGNVDTRLRKLDESACDALVLAAAGLVRLDLAARISAHLPLDTSVPAPGQGIVAVEIAAAASSIKQTVSRISDPDAETAMVAERAVVQALGASCQMPLGAIAFVEGQELRLIGLVASLDGRRVVRATVQGNRGSAAKAGEKLARVLLDKGAAEILAG